MKGDALASGQRSATFSVAPGLRNKYTEGQIHDDLTKLTSDEFILKHMCTQREYDMLMSNKDNPERVFSFTAEQNQRAEFYNRQLAADAKQEASLRRDCPIEPFVPQGISGRVIVTRDAPARPVSKLALPRSLRKDKEMLPTTGHVIKENLVFDSNMWDLTNHASIAALSLIGKRVLFSPMSGTAICFKNFPTWIQLELSEILAIVNMEDVELVEEELESMV